MLAGRHHRSGPRQNDKKKTKKEEEEYLIRSNKNTGHFDFEILDEFFDEKDLTEWGFDEEELNFDKFEGDTQEDDFVVSENVKTNIISEKIMRFLNFMFLLLFTV